MVNAISAEWCGMTRGCLMPEMSLFALSITVHLSRKAVCVSDVTEPARNEILFWNGSIVK